MARTNKKPEFWSCYRKRRYAKKPDAQATIDKMGAETGRTMDRLHPYMCPTCRGYHIGNAPQRERQPA